VFLRSLAQDLAPSSPRPGSGVKLAAAVLAFMAGGVKSDTCALTAYQSEPHPEQASWWHIMWMPMIVAGLISLAGMIAGWKLRAWWTGSSACDVPRQLDADLRGSQSGALAGEPSVEQMVRCVRCWAEGAALPTETKSVQVGEFYLDYSPADGVVTISPPRMPKSKDLRIAAISAEAAKETQLSAAAEWLDLPNPRLGRADAAATQPASTEAARVGAAVAQPSAEAARPGATVQQPGVPPPPHPPAYDIVDFWAVLFQQGHGAVGGTVGPTPFSA